MNILAASLAVIAFVAARAGRMSIVAGCATLLAAALMAISRPHAVSVRAAGPVELMAALTALGVVLRTTTIRVRRRPPS